jgi:hypothetical protein
MRRVRPTWLLHLVVSVVCLLLTAAVLLLIVVLGAATGGVITTAVLLLLLSLLVDFELLPWWIERAFARRAGPPSAGSIWFVDVDAQRERERQAFHEDTHDNPTVR